MYVTEIKKY